MAVGMGRQSGSTVTLTEMKLCWGDGHENGVNDGNGSWPCWMHSASWEAVLFQPLLPFHGSSGLAFQSLWDPFGGTQALPALPSV